jgi:hypothetical protein
MNVHKHVTAYASTHKRDVRAHKLRGGRAIIFNILIDPSAMFANLSRTI